MKSYRLNIEVIIATVGIFSLLVFSIVLILFNITSVESVLDLLIDYGYIIAPAGIVWIMTDKFLWHTNFFQAIKKQRTYLRI